MKDSLSPSVRHRLETIEQTPELFTPNQNIIDALGEKSLVMLVGPCATGKSYLIDQLVTRDDRFRKSRSFTSRPARADDTPDTIRYISWSDADITQFCNDIEAGDFVNFTFHPKTHEIYGTALQDHPGQYNLMPTLANSVAPLEKLPFAAAPVVGIVTPPTQWEEWFAHREFTSSSDREARVQEGIAATAWLLNRTDVSIVSNQPNTDAAAEIQSIVQHQTIARDENTAHELLQHLQQL